MKLLYCLCFFILSTIVYTKLVFTTADEYYNESIKLLKTVPSSIDGVNILWSDMTVDSSNKELFNNVNYYLQNSVKLNPIEAKYWLYYGLNSIILRRFKVAKNCFYEANSLTYRESNPDDMKKLIRRGVRKLRKLAPTLYKSFSIDKFKMTNKNIAKKFPTIQCDELYDPVNVEYMAGRLPFKLVGCNDYFNLTGMTYDSLYDFGDSMADFYPHNIFDRNTAHPYMSPLDEALDELIYPSDHFKHDDKFPGSYIQWNLNQENWERFVRKRLVKLPVAFEWDDNWLNSCLSPEMRDAYMIKVHWRMLLIGTEGAGMFNHFDTLKTSSWQGHLVGEKLWHLCAPSQTEYLYGDGKIDCFNPDYEEFPNFAKADCFIDTVRPGEFVFYPKDYWHQVRNMESPTISVTGTMTDQNNYKDVMRILKEECSTGKYNWKFPKQLCKELKDNCYDYWKNEFETKKTILSLGEIYSRKA